MTSLTCTHQPADIAAADILFSILAKAVLLHVGAGHSSGTHFAPLARLCQIIRCCCWPVRCKHLSPPAVAPLIKAPIRAIAPPNRAPPNRAAPDRAAPDPTPQRPHTAATATSSTSCSGLNGAAALLPTQLLPPAPPTTQPSRPMRPVHWVEPGASLQHFSRDADAATDEEATQASRARPPPLKRSSSGGSGRACAAGPAAGGAVPG